MLERKVMIDGKIYDVHEISLITHNIYVGETVVTISSSNAEESIERSTAFPLTDGLTFTQAETAAWELPMYAEYVDESTELLNEVLDILTDEQAETVAQLYPEWAIGVHYTVGKRVRYEGLLYRCEQEHTSQEDYTPLVKALWTRVAAEDEILDWVAPTGAQDAYNKDDKVRHNGKIWISVYDGANVWEPGVFGWEEVTE